MISVAICTFNRAASLALTLETLEAQQGVDDAWELLIVENNCTDSTPEVVSRFAGRLPLRRIVESEQGLSHARNRAIAEARGDLLVFTDDDVRLDPEWLRAFIRAPRCFPAAGYFAGRIVPDWEGDPPRWFRPETAHLFDGVLVSYDLGSSGRPLRPEDPLPVGASFAVRRELFERNGEFRADLGVRGAENGRGEETEYLLRAQQAGTAGAYIGEARCWHPVDRGRFGLARLYRHGVASGVAYRKIQAPEQSGSLARGLLFLARGAYQLLLGRGDRFRRCILNCGIEVGMRSAARGEAR